MYLSDGNKTCPLVFFFYLRILHLLLIVCLWDAKFLFQRVPGCNGIVDFPSKIVLWVHNFAVVFIDMGNSFLLLLAQSHAIITPGSDNLKF